LAKGWQGRISANELRGQEVFKELLKVARFTAHVIFLLGVKMDSHNVALAIAFNDKVRMKLPKKRLYRTNSIANELRNIGKPFEWFTKNSIVIHPQTESPSQLRKTVFITGSLTCFKVRVDLWKFVNNGDFFYFEIIAPNGRALLYRLVDMDILDHNYLPKAVQSYYEPHGGVSL